MRRRRRPLMRGAMVAGAGYAAGNARAKGKAQDAEQEQRIARARGAAGRSGSAPGRRTGPTAPPAVSPTTP